MSEEKEQPAQLVLVRRGSQEMRIDLPTLVSLIQMGVVDGTAEVKADTLTRGEWAKLGELELFRTFRPEVVRGRIREKLHKPIAPGSQVPAPRPGSLEACERNLAGYFESLAMKRLRVDAWVSIIGAVLTALLSALAHHSLLAFLPAALAWAGGYVFVDRVLFQGWIRKIRSSGFKRLPWNSRYFIAVTIAVPGYFLVASFVPLMAGERVLVVVDSIMCLLYGAAMAAVWSFRTSTLRSKHAFEVSTEVSSAGRDFVSKS